MSNLTINHSTPIQLNTNTPAARPAAAAAPAAEAAKASSLANDVVKIQSGVGPSLKGAGVGLLAGGVLGGGGAALMFKAANGAGEGGIVLAILGLGVGAAGAVGGAAGGALAANKTDSKLKGAGYGALGGAVAGAVGGAALSLKGGQLNVGTMALTAAAGAAFGAVGGVAGSFVAKHQ